MTDHDHMIITNVGLAIVTPLCFFFSKSTDVCKKSTKGKFGGLLLLVVYYCWFEAPKGVSLLSLKKGNLKKNYIKGQLVWKSSHMLDFWNFLAKGQGTGHASPIFKSKWKPIDLKKGKFGGLLLLVVYYCYLEVTAVSLQFRLRCSHCSFSAGTVATVVSLEVL